MTTYADRALETTTTTGTGDMTTAGAVTGYRTLNAAVGTGVMVDYCIVAVDASGVPTGDWEAGMGYLSASTTFVRANPKSGSAATPISFAAGTKRIFITQIADNVADHGMITACYTGQNMP